MKVGVTAAHNPAWPSIAANMARAFRCCRIVLPWVIMRISEVLRMVQATGIFTLLCSLLALGSLGADWPQLRGPDGAGLCPRCGKLPTEFGPRKNVLWKTDLPPGKSSPVLVGDRIFLTAAEGDDLITICLSRTTGKVEWRRSVRAVRHEFQNK